MSSKSVLETLSKFEWQIMNRIWEMGSASAREVLNALPAEHQRAYTTIQTYTERLVKKGFLTKEKIGLVNFYKPLIPRENAVKHETNRFVDQVFGGSMSQLAAYLAGRHEFSIQDLAQLKKMLEEDGDA